MLKLNPFLIFPIMECKQSTHLFCLCIFTDEGLVKHSKLWGIVIYIQNLNEHRDTAALLWVVCNDKKRDKNNTLPDLVVGKKRIDLRAKSFNSLLKDKKYTVLLQHALLT